MSIKSHDIRLAIIRNEKGFSLPEVLVALFITGLFIAVIAPVMRDTLYHGGRLTERLPMARILATTLRVDRTELSALAPSSRGSLNGLTVTRSVRPLRSIIVTPAGTASEWQPVMVSTSIRSESGTTIEGDVIMLRRLAP